MPALRRDEGGEGAVMIMLTSWEVLDFSSSMDKTPLIGWITINTRNV
jgi:hypothetical protein